VDINRVYRSLFDVKGIVDGVFTAVSPGKTARDQTIHKKLGLAWDSESTIDLDAFVSALVGSDPVQIHYLKMAADSFGRWDDESVTLASGSGIKVFGQAEKQDKRTKPG
jgi:uncharacterized protein (DUF362 family)